MKKLLILPLFFIYACAHAPAELSTLAPAAATEIVLLPPQAVPKAKPISVIAVGDIMLGTSYPSPHLLPANDDNILKNVEAILKDANITIGNLEGAMFDSGGTPKLCINPLQCYVFRTPAKYGQYLADAGLDIVSLANNHSGDFGPIGRKKTKETLDSFGIKYAGLAGVNEHVILEKDGIKYGFAAFAPNSGTVSIHDTVHAEQLVQMLKKSADIVIISFHGGAEGEAYERVPKRSELFLGENRGDVHDFAHKMIDAGADLVFGHGPHVTRAVELYKNKFISYSSGNFATYGRFGLSGAKGIAPVLKINLDKNGDFLDGKIISTYQTPGNGPRVDESNRAFAKIVKLTKIDFPDTLLMFSDNNSISKKIEIPPTPTPIAQ